ncbi:MAG: class I SAM-dependent methyltransferase, partial [Candidatus Helarchaeota archaeon]
MTKFESTREVIKYSLKYISGKTLDLGAGSAKYRNIIKQKASEYITFDMIPGPHIDVVGNVLDLPFEDKTFDTIISTQVLEHVEKPWIMIKEIHRVLKKNGICILTA